MLLTTRVSRRQREVGVPYLSGTSELAQMVEQRVSLYDIDACAGSTPALTPMW